MSFKDLPKEFDLIVIGGGITGAGILREAVRCGLRTLLVEKQDFAQGTSSRSSKMVHGGLRYLKEGKIFLTKAAVEERCRLLNEAPGLVEKMGFLWPIYKGESPGKHSLEIGLTLYDFMAREKQHEYFHSGKFLLLTPHVRQDKLIGGFKFFDAQVDDARLVMRLITESRDLGGTALNYTAATQILRDEENCAVGVAIQDVETGETFTAASRAVINATGWWAERLYPSPVEGLHIRPLRGSHILFPAHKLPAAQAVAFAHPVDKRPIFVLPWEGATMVGTTDLDHKDDPWQEPAMSRRELDYIMDGIHGVYPSLQIGESDIISSFAGVRPVLSRGKKDPSQESREHVVWVDKGLVTIIGGKLTTFRLMALDALEAAEPFMERIPQHKPGEPIFAPVPAQKPADDKGLTAQAWRRLYGRYGVKAPQLVEEAPEGALEAVGDTETLYAELPWAAKNETIRRLSDLMLRRTRLGLLTPKGGEEFLDRIIEYCKPFLDWDDERWEEEREAYLEIVKKAYSIPA
ncbi:glycerol-3-phosphate dehydrogenase [Desulfatibacillum alkenivorans DSM 16219]|jgi:glycerol-3-phosphate dehydrogenase|uniref:Glycerol-3-phosphate dehydrogenase n=1 Tax=Desulfatibacillum alkenivorans DSM 16219 TaxID=1121393 RepID=A0A1M6DWL8_9BACT|nr:glycerol-3-phosphate dehydrogenase/oxidase [Desulfatibacillum alkenivorans]SHI77428.1 glycerol-3-phosphate dehydrogenase [Desulfatibacillum alkenivorans DSM 16219]